MEDKETAVDFFREAIAQGQTDARFGDVALEELCADLESVAQEIGKSSDSEEDNEKAVAMLRHAQAAILYLHAQVEQDCLVIEGLAGDLDRATEQGRTDGE